jgi:hypothetical protein
MKDEIEILYDDNGNKNPIEISSFRIERKIKRVLGLRERNPNFLCYLLGISCEKLPDSLEGDTNQIIKLSFDGKIGSKFEYFEITEREISGQILMYYNELHIKESQIHKESIIEILKLKLFLQSNRNKDDVKEEAFEQKIKIFKQNAIARIRIRKEEKFNKKVIYKSGIYDFGSLIIENQAQPFCYPLNIKDLSFVVIDSKDKPTYNAIHIKSNSVNSSKDGNGINNVLCKNNILPSIPWEVLLEIDLGKIDPPNGGPENYSIKITGAKSVTNKQPDTPINFSDFETCFFELEPNKTETDLKVFYVEGNTNEEVEITNRTEPIKLKSCQYDLNENFRKNLIVCGYFGNRGELLN